jgi:hypothetical protein
MKKCLECEKEVTLGYNYKNLCHECINKYIFNKSYADWVKKYYKNIWVDIDIIRKDKEDMVNHPPHYTKWNIEVIDFILDQKLWYLESNIIKYICRYKHKNWLEDLEKSKFYLDRLIKEQWKTET